VDLYLPAAWQLWRRLPTVERSQDPEKVRAAAEAVLRVLDDAVGVLVDGRQSEPRATIRHEEALRAEFVDDLLRGDADVSRMIERAEPFGIDLSTSHHVAPVVPRDAAGSVDRAATVLELAVVDRFGDREVLVSTRDGRMVVVVPGPGLGFADRLGLDSDVLHARDLLACRVLGRDQPAIPDLVRNVLDR
jgi:sugar diacid utilization regulator